MFKKAFSLIELLIVVLIVGVVYTLAISSFENLKNAKDKPSLLNLKHYLSSIKHKEYVELICLDRCDSCSVIVDGELEEELSKAFDGFLTKDVKVYNFNINTGLQLVRESIFFNSEDVSENICFNFKIDKKGISNQVIVEYKNNAYDFTTALGLAKKYASIDELIEEKQRLVNEVLD